MPRPVGSKNKPKTATDLLEKIKDIYQKQGKRFSFNVADIAENELTPELKASIAEAQKANPDLNVDGIFELQQDEDEIDTYRCGACGKELDGQDSKCPHCGVKLSW